MRNDLSSKMCIDFIASTTSQSNHFSYQSCLQHSSQKKKKKGKNQKQKTSLKFIKRSPSCLHMNKRYCSTDVFFCFQLINAIHCHFMQQMCSLLTGRHSSQTVSRHTEVIVLSAGPAVQLSVGLLQLQDCPFTSPLPQAPLPPNCTLIASITVSAVR